MWKTYDDEEILLKDFEMKGGKIYIRKANMRCLM